MSRSMALLNLNGITEEYFQIYKEEYNYIQDHFKEYGNVPDRETFINKFPDFEIIQVLETDKYLVETLNEEHLYSITVPIINEVAELIKTDSYSAAQYLQSKLPDLLGKSPITGSDIISQAKERYEEWVQLKENRNDFLIPSGFKELDEVIGGFHTGEELVVLFARTGNGKSWVLIKMLEHAWKMNKRVGLIEPEMSPNKTGYRFDTLHANVSNSALTKGIEITEYEKYIENLSKSDIPFFVATPREFKRKITVSKLKMFVESNKLDILAIDGISYLKDERSQRGDSRTISLTNISEDLMDLSNELKIPVIIVAQSNREGAKQEDLELENIRDSDGIAYNASLIISVAQKDPGLELALKKNRNGKNGIKLTYLWDIDRGVFNYVPSDTNSRDDIQVATEVRNYYVDSKEVF